MNGTIISITLRGLLGRRRALLLIPLPLVVIGIGLLARDSTQAEAVDILNGLGLSTVLPLTALILGTAVLGSEMEDGNLVHLLSKPISRAEILLSKLLVAVVATVLVGAVPILIAGILMTGSYSSIARGFFVGALAGSVLYPAIFVALSAVTKRAVVFGLVYLLLWEGVLGTWLRGTRMLSVRHYLLQFADAASTSPFIDADVSFVTSVIMSAVLLGLAVWFGTDRLRSYHMANEAI
jgi:ABC-2 type transport system permease protein